MIPKPPVADPREAIAPSTARVPVPNAGAWLALIVLVAAALRAGLAARSPAWFVEIAILESVRRPFGDMLALLSRDIHPPLMFSLRWLVTAAGGGDGAQKALSIAAAALTLVPLFTLGRRLFGERAALLAAALAALSPALVLYGQEIEDYAIQWLLTLSLAHFAFAWCEERRRRDALGYVACAILLLYNHYLSFAVLAVAGLAGVAMLWREPRALGTWALLHAAALAAFVPQARTFAEQYAREGSGSFFAFPSDRALLGLWRTFGFGSRVVAGALSLLALVPCFDRRTARPALALAGFVALSILAPRFWVVIVPREVLFTFPFAFLLAAAGAVRLPVRPLRGAVALGLCAWGVWSAARVRPNDEMRATEAALAHVLAEARPGELALHAESHSLLYFTWHDRTLRQRVLVAPGARVPYFEGGLLVPDSLLMTSAQWDSALAAGRTAWGVRVDRAFVTRGRVSRAGLAGEALFRGVAGEPAWRRAPVSVWRVTPHRRG